MFYHVYKSCQFLMCDILTWKNNHLDRHNRGQDVGGREVEEKMSNNVSKMLPRT